MDLVYLNFSLLRFNCLGFELVAVQINVYPFLLFPSSHFTSLSHSKTSSYDSLKELRRLVACLQFYIQPSLLREYSWREKERGGGGGDVIPNQSNIYLYPMNLWFITKWHRQAFEQTMYLGIHPPTTPNAQTLYLCIHSPTLKKKERKREWQAGMEAGMERQAGRQAGR